ncbi:MAG: hypothetical protein M3430_08555 [Acidobacteriota bacterium]|nr:hypothetical protein [Acidobacteriota bacterium]
MDFIDLWKLLNLGVIADWENKTITLRLGPLTLNKLPIPALKAFASNPSTLDPILVDLFVRHSAMWEDLTAENPSEVHTSLKKLSKDAQTYATQLAMSSKSIDQEVASILHAWSGDADIAAKKIDAAIKTENLPENSGMDGYSRQVMDDELRNLRKKYYPSIEFLVTLLPDGSRVRKQVVEFLSNGKNTLVAHYGVAVSAIPSATAELH